MAFVRYTPWERSSFGERAAVGHEERRRSIRSDRLGVGTLACRSCDAPVAIGSDPLSLTTQLACPFCGRTGSVRDFLSMAVPTRPARVIVRIGLRTTAGTGRAPTS